MTQSPKDTAGEGVAEVIAFPGLVQTEQSLVEQSPVQHSLPQDQPAEHNPAGNKGAESSSADVSVTQEPVAQEPVAQEPADADTATQWPGQLIDLQQARAMAGLADGESAGVESADATPSDAALFDVAALDAEAGVSVEGDADEESAAESALTTARHIALRSLAARARSEAELRQKLADRGVERPAVDQVIDRLVSEGLINDAQLAEDIARGLSESKKMGPVGIKQALVKRRIPRGIIDQVAAGLDEVDDDTLEELARSRMRVLRGLDRAVQVRRLVGFLARRGYQGPDVYRVVDLVVDEPEGGWDPDSGAASDSGPGENLGVAEGARVTRLSSRGQWGSRGNSRGNSRGSSRGSS
jgi:regulatory protein